MWYELALRGPSRLVTASTTMIPVRNRLYHRLLWSYRGHGEDGDEEFTDRVLLEIAGEQANAQGAVGVAGVVVRADGFGERVGESPGEFLVFLEELLRRDLGRVVKRQ